MDKIDELLTRGVNTIYPSKEELEKVLRSGKKIKLYLGVDPTGEDLHIGHAVPLNKIKQFQALGHEVVLLIGDFTGLIGDPTGKSETRKVQTKKQVENNAKHYQEQAGRIIRFDGDNPICLKYNSQWLGKLSFLDFLNIATNLTVPQLQKRDMFKKRLNENQDVYLHEFIYPVMQGYDSVALKVDLEVGGTDQMFNMLVGRDLQKKLNNQEKFVLTVPLLADSSGKKIGKTEGNVIRIMDKPEDLYGKIMSLPDSAIVPCFELITNLPMSEIETIKKELEKNVVNPMDYKKKLAHQIVEQYNDLALADSAQRTFEQNYQEGKKDQAAEEVSIKDPVRLHEFIFKNFHVSSASIAKQLIKQGGVKINGKKLDDISFIYEPKDDDIIEVGKHRVYRVKK